MKVKFTQPGPRYGALIQLLRTSEALWNASRVFFERWDLSPSQFNILNVLRDHDDGLSQIELSRELITHRSNVTGLIDRLEKRGLVQRRDSAVDRRVYRIQLTKAGQNLLAEILPHYFQAAEAVWGDVSARHAAQLVAEFTKISANATAMAERESRKG
ncbi:MAG: MarR family transcriptional regulator [Verrucomicrobia bacterium]|nr:MarR family transcriptional regulator [Verrucomicrobiota bacterium]